LSLLLSGYSIRVLGDVYLAEILLSLMALSSIMRGEKVFKLGRFHYLPILFILWFFANLLSSLLNGKSYALTLISIATVTITGLTFRAVFDFFVRFPDRILDSLIFFGLGRLVGIVIDPMPYTEQLPWKFGYGEWIIFLGLVLVAKTKVTKIFWILAPILILISLVNEARTLALLTIGSAFMALFATNKRVTISFIIGASFLPLVLYFGYLDLALGGQLGAKEMGRAHLLAESDLGPLAARKEFIFSTRAFAVSPILGYGFDPQVNREIIASGYQELLENGIKVDYAYLQELPIHSFLMSSLVQGGVFAGLFWIFSLFSSLKALLLSLEKARHARPLIAYLSLSLVDRILFSPFGAYERLNVALFLSYLLALNLSGGENDKQVGRR
jgi:hypothetical protein